MSLFLYLNKIEEEERMARCLFGDRDRAPDFNTTNLIERNHICEKCGNDVNYVRDESGGIRDYHFECKDSDCGWSGKNAPLKKKS
jgi:hypothetical protein